MEGWPICSAISSTASGCIFFFFLKEQTHVECWPPTNFSLTFLHSASLFVFNSVRALVAPPVSLSRPSRLLSYLARSDLRLLASALTRFSVASSSSNISILGETLWIVFWTLDARDCSSSFSLLEKDQLDLSLLNIVIKLLLLSSLVTLE